MLKEWRRLAPGSHGELVSESGLLTFTLFSFLSQNHLQKQEIKHAINIRHYSQLPPSYLFSMSFSRPVIFTWKCSWLNAFLQAIQIITPKEYFQNSTTRVNVLFLFIHLILPEIISRTLLVGGKSLSLEHSSFNNLCQEK